MTEYAEADKKLIYSMNFTINNKTRNANNPDCANLQCLCYSI